MTILVDYTCATCGQRAEHWTTSPPPGTVACPACGAESRRRFGAVGLATGQRPAHATTAAPASTRRGPTLCQQYPQIPGLCHMSESAARMWVAKATRDVRAVDREQERQETSAASRTPVLGDAITHHHRGPGSSTPPAASAGSRQPTGQPSRQPG